jgi:hypothetical protein
MNAPKPPPKPTAKKQKTSANTSLAASSLAITTADDVHTPQGANERHVGKKKEKQILRQHATNGVPYGKEKISIC